MIPEAAVEAAVGALADKYGGTMTACDIEYIRDILEAAAPYIAARALEDAADAFEDLPVNKGATISTGTADWFELFPVQHIRDRAEDIRAGKS